MPDAVLLAQDMSFPLPLGADGAPPREILIFKKGDNPATKGVFFYDDESGAECMSRFAAQGEDLPIDFHHWSERVDDEEGKLLPEQTRAAGWFGLDARPDGLYVVGPPHLKLQREKPGIYYCADVEAGIRQLHWRYYSPAVMYRPMPDGRLKVCGIRSLALTHKPSLIGQAPLLASQSSGGVNTPEKKQMDEQKALLARAEAAERELLTARPFVTFAVALLAAKDISEAQSKLQLLKDKADRADIAEKEILSLRRTSLETELKAELSAAKSAKKVTPAEEKELEKLVLGDGKAELSAEALSRAQGQLTWLKGFLSAKAPVVGATNQGKDGKVTEAPRSQIGQATPITLSVDGKDLKYEELSNLQKQEAKEQDPQLFTAAREDWQRRGSPSAPSAK
jgi:phage I-like protein